MKNYPIRKISTGPDYKDAMHFTVGQSVIKDKVTRLFTSEITLIRKEGVKDFSVWVKKLDTNESYLWKSIVDVPMHIEYKIDY